MDMHITAIDHGDRVEIRISARRGRGKRVRRKTDGTSKRVRRSSHPTKHKQLTLW
jgi:hypothetical protein